MSNIKWYRYLGIIIINLAAIEIFSFLICEYIVGNRAASLLYTPPQIELSEFQTYQGNRDPILGWPTRDALNGDGHDASGSRPVPAFPILGGECLTLYGDSFTYGSGVSDEEAWGNLLASRFECRVGNFGVGGYGTDQSLLRFLANSTDKAPVSILGIFPHDIMRNVTQYLYLQSPGNASTLTFKPRYVIDGDEPRMIPLPDPSFSDFQFFDDRFDHLLPYEEFLPSGNIGPVPKRFPFALTLFKLLLHDTVHNWVLGSPGWQDFLDENHPTKALQITAGIVREFDDECKKRTKKCFALFFPTPSSYNSYIDDGRISLNSIFKKLEENGFPYLSLTPFLAERLGQRSICEILSKPNACTGHFNAEGNGIIADIVGNYITQNELL